MEGTEAIILFVIPLLTVIASWLLLYFRRKHPKPQSIEQWPLRFVDFNAGVDKFNTLVDSFAAKPGYKVGSRDNKGVFLTESFIKWKRIGLSYYICIDEARKMVIVYYQSYSVHNEGTAKAVSEVLAHFANA